MNDFVDRGLSSSKFNMLMHNKNNNLLINLPSPVGFDGFFGGTVSASEGLSGAKLENLIIKKRHE